MPRPSDKGFCLAFIGLFAVLECPKSPVRAQEVAPLEPGQSVERVLAGGETHRYRLRIEAGQHLKIEVTQNFVDVRVQLSTANGEMIADVRRDGLGALPEVLETAAENSGEHVLAILPIENNAQPAYYQARWIEARAATARERQLAVAQRREIAAQNLLPTGKYAEAAAIARDALAFRQEFLSENRNDQYDYAQVLNLLGNIHRQAGDAVNALSRYEEAGKIWRRILAPDHPSVAVALNNEGLACQDLGDFERAEPLLREALALREQRVGRTSVELTPMLNNLAVVCRSKKDLPQAETLFRRVVEIFEAGKTPVPNMASAYSNLGAVLMERDKIEEAETALNKALEIHDQLKAAPTHPSRGFSYATLSSCSFKKRDYVQAEALALKALGILELSLSPEHPRMIELLFNLSATYRAIGKLEQATARREAACEQREMALRRNLTIGSERQKLAMMAFVARETNDTLSLHAQAAPNDPQALELAFTTWLRRKGRALDEMNRTIEGLRRQTGPDAASLFDRLAGKLRDYSRLALGVIGAKERAALKTLNEEIEQLQAEISRRSVPFRVELQTVKLADVRHALPAKAALVEFARYAPVDAATRKEAAPHYLAYVLPKAGPARWVELGDAARIDRTVNQLRTAFRPQRTGLLDPRPAARKLNRLVMEPIRPLLGDTRQVFLAPDGELNLIPFGALMNERGRYLVEDYLLVYLTSGRDLLRLQTKHHGGGEVMIFAAPDYDDESGGAPDVSGAASQSDDRRRGKLSQSRGAASLLKFKELRAAPAEAEAIRHIWPDARVFLGRQALESAVKQVQRPRILHVITHGVFLEDQSKSDSAGWENPLLSSWLALAGANQRRSGIEDGILTAYEAAALNLWGTKLVVLSACETGLGAVKTGEGVYGLRRALVLAGAETQLTSLWKIDDSVTKNLMESYYGNLRDGSGRADALRQAQLALLKSRALRHPYYWAGFVAIGEWAALDDNSR